MTQIKLEIKDASQVPFFLELIKNFKFIKKIEIDEDKLTKEEVLAGIAEAVDELNEILKSKKKGKDAFKMLDDL
jgi:hypothetical protein